MLRVALIGCGAVGDVHAKVMAGVREVSFTACCDPNMKQALRVSYTYNIKAYSGLKELIDGESPDVIHITAPHYTHVPLAVYALRRGIHVLMEPPIATTMSDMHILQREAAKSEAQLGVCLQNRYNPASLYVKELLTRGEAGKVLSARVMVCLARDTQYYTQSSWRGCENTEGCSVMVTQSLPTLDLLQWLWEDPLEVEGHLSNRNHQDDATTPDTAEACLYYGLDSRALFYGSNNYGINAPPFIELCCDNCRIQLIGDECHIISDKGEVFTPQLEREEIIGKNHWGAGHKALIEDFYRHIEEKRPFALDAVEGCRALKTCLRIEEANEENVRIIY